MIRKPNALALQALYGVSGEWILTGEGNMWIQAKDLGTPRQVVEVPIVMGLPEWDSEGRVFAEGVERYPFSEAFIRSALKMAGAGTVDHLFATVISGNSMQPTLLNGDLVLVNTALELRRTPKNAALHLVRKDSCAKEVRAKRVYNPTGALTFASDNPSFPVIPINLSETEVTDVVLGRILWYGRHLQALPSEGDDW